MTLTSNHLSGGYAFTYDFAPVGRPCAEVIPPVPSAPEDELDTAEPANSPASIPLVEVRSSATLPPHFEHEATSALFVEPALAAPLEHEPSPYRETTVPSLEGDVDAGGAKSIDSPSVKPASDPKWIVACAMSGNLCAVATLESADSSLKVSRKHSRLFQLTDTSQSGMRSFAVELFQLLDPLRGAVMVSCPTRTGSVLAGLEDEARIETLLMMLPELKVEQIDNDVIAKWVVSANPPYPENMPNGRNTYAQIRAIEAAQYIAQGMA